MIAKCLQCQQLLDISAVSPGQPIYCPKCGFGHRGPVPDASLVVRNFVIVGTVVACVVLMFFVPLVLNATGMVSFKDELTLDVERKITPLCERYGWSIKEFSDDSKAYRIGETVSFSGTGSTGRRIVKIEVRYHVAEFNNSPTWKLTNLSINGASYYE